MRSGYENVRKRPFERDDCHFRRKLKKNVSINQSDCILIGLRDYEDAKANVIIKYTPDETRNIKTYGEFSETVTLEHIDTVVGQSVIDKEQNSAVEVVELNKFKLEFEWKEKSIT